MMGTRRRRHGRLRRSIASGRNADRSRSARLPRHGGTVLAAALASLAGAGCDDGTLRDPAKTQAAEPSPNANLQPARLTGQQDLPGVERTDAQLREAEPESESRFATGSSVSLAAAWREDVPPEANTLDAREASGVRMQGQFFWFDVPAPPPAPEVDPSQVKQLLEQTMLRVRIDLLPVGRMRVEFVSPAFVVPQRTELRSRQDAYGHLLVWPDGESYRVLPPGTLRTLLGERRADAIPLVPRELEPQGAGNWIGLATARSRLLGPLGELRLEQAEVSGLSSGGDLLCRLLVELIGVQPASAGCEPGWVPLRADYQWHEGGRFSFNVRSIVRHHEIDLDGLLVPPAGCSYRAHGYPRPERPQVIPDVQLRLIRSKDGPHQADPRGVAVKGLHAVNASHVMKAVLVDGIPIAWLPPGSEINVPTLRPGRYAVAFRDFWGNHVRAPNVVQMPAHVVDGVTGNGGVSP